MKKELTRYIAAFTLGDGFLRRRNKTCNASYALNQLYIHKEYIEWQASILESLTSVSIKYVNAYNDGYNHRAQYRLLTKTHPMYTTMHDRIYMNGRKTVSPHDLKLLDFESMAIWYMDDGFILRSSNRANGDMTLCTDNFTFAEVSLLQKAIWERLEIPFNIRRKQTNTGVVFRLTCTRKNTPKLISGIEKYIFPSFQYKLHTNDIPTRDGDIV